MELGLGLSRRLACNDWSSFVFFELFINVPKHLSAGYPADFVSGANSQSVIRAIYTLYTKDRLGKRREEICLGWTSVGPGLRVWPSAIFIGRSARSEFFEISDVLVRLDHVASGIVNAGHSIM
jgi:hypothetical protein